VTPFVVFAMPRSRSYWLSHFLTYGDWQCGHDVIHNFRALADIASWLSQPCTGTVETAAAPFWRLLPAGVRVATVRRPIPEVLASLRRGGMVFDDADMLPIVRHLDAKLVQIAQRLPDVFTTTFAELGTESGCAAIFEHLLPYRHDTAWWRAAAGVNLQVNLRHAQRRFTAFGPQMYRMAAIARQRILLDLQKPAPLNGMVFAQEPFGGFLADGQRLFAEHCVVMGGAPDYWTTIDIPLLQRLDDTGGLHVFTLRSNNRLFGYLLSVVGPDLDVPGRHVAEQVTFFCDPDWPGIGLRLQRAAIADMRAKGIGKVVMQANVPRIDALYRRLGAAPVGQMYGLELN
jgi:hypothetical protein